VIQSVSAPFTAVTRVQIPLGNATILTALLQLPMNVIALKSSSKIQKIAKPISISQPRRPTLIHMREVHIHRFAPTADLFMQREISVH
jgi:hypothetical protein